VTTSASPRSVAQRRLDMEQALASARIEGFVADAEFLADCEAVVTGQLSTEEALQRSKEKALAADRKAHGED
jgi:Antitoxin VbhA